MLILALLAAILLGYLLGGRLSRFADACLHAVWLPAAALLLQKLYLRPWTLILSYLLLFAFIWLNRHMKKSALLMGAGSLCNLLVITINGFRMPVSEKALALLSSDRASALLAGDIPMYCSANAHTRLLFLGDVLVIRLPLVGGVASIGDILLAFGVFGLILGVMDPEKLHRKRTTK